MMNRLEEIEKVKTILLNKDQLPVFNMLSKQSCSLYSDNIQQHEYNNRNELQNDKKRFNKAIDNFKQRFNKNLGEDDVNSIDLRLIDQLPKELKNNFISKIQ